MFHRRGPHSIALALREEGVPAAVLGTDASRDLARRGAVNIVVVLRGSRGTIERCFRKTRRTICSAEVRRDVEFRYLNLASDHYPALSSGVWGRTSSLPQCVDLLRPRHDCTRGEVVARFNWRRWVAGARRKDPSFHDFVKCEVVQTDEGLAYRHFKGTSRRSMRSTPTPSFSVRLRQPVVVVDRGGAPRGSRAAGPPRRGAGARRPCRRRRSR